MMTSPTPIDPQHEEISSRPVLRPAVDILENRDEILLIADMPGLTSDAIQLDLDGETLTLRGRRPDPIPEGVRLLAGQRADFEYKRAFQLPEAIDRDRIAASYKDGVLEVRLPRHERTRPRRIAIETA
jgi:HSP20 family protein